MKTVGLKVLKNKLSEYVRIAASGETVLVTDRDRVVAELNPPQPTHKHAGESVITRGIREGWITPAKRRGPPLPPPPAVMTLEEMLEDLARSREDR